MRLVTFECFDQFLQFLLIIACVGDISKLQLYIWSSYGPLAEIKKIFSLSIPLFFEVYGVRKTWNTACKGLCNFASAELFQRINA
jgi:hypothetical protein